MSLPHDLAISTLDRIIDRFDLQEVTAEGGGPLLPLTSEMAGDVGCMRILHGGPVHKLVYIGIAVPAIRIDSHMLFAFSAPDSLLPHFTLDSVQAPAGPPTPDTPITNAFHLDLIPRVDLAANLAYIDTVYGALEKPYAEAKALDGLSEADLSRRQWAMMSPYMLASRADDAAFTAIGDTVGTYLDHWFGLCESGIALDTVVGADLGERDRAHRSALFSADVDPVWDLVARMVGRDLSEEMRLNLVDQDVPA